MPEAKSYKYSTASWTQSCPHRTDCQKVYGQEPWGTQWEGNRGSCRSLLEASKGFLKGFSAGLRLEGQVGIHQVKEHGGGKGALCGEGRELEKWDSSPRDLNAPLEARLQSFAGDSPKYCWREQWMLWGTLDELDSACRVPVTVPPPKNAPPWTGAYVPLNTPYLLSACAVRTLS